MRELLFYKLEHESWNDIKNNFSNSKFEFLNDKEILRKSNYVLNGEIFYIKIINIEFKEELA